VDKKKRNLIITIIGIIAVFVIGTIAYNQLQTSSTPQVLMTPQLASYTPPEQPKAMAVQESTVAPQAPVEVQEQEEAIAVEQTEEIADAIVEEEEEDDGNPFMPDIPLYTLDDEETSFETVRAGRPAIINYFASWCPPCKAELPYFERAWMEHGDDIAFIFLDSIDGQRETKATIKRFIAEFPFAGPVYWDEGIFAYLFQTTSLPTTIFIDGDGRIMGGQLGMVAERTLDAIIEEMLR